MTSNAILDTNIVIYLITGNEEYAERATYAIRHYTQGGCSVYLPVVVVAEALYVLEGKFFQYERDQATTALEKFILNSKIACQDKDAVLYALQRHKTTGIDFVDGYCASLAIQNQVDLITNDTRIVKHTTAPHRLI